MRAMWSDENDNGILKILFAAGSAVVLPELDRVCARDRRED